MLVVGQLMIHARVKHLVMAWFVDDALIGRIELVGARGEDGERIVDLGTFERNIEMRLVLENRPAHVAPILIPVEWRLSASNSLQSLLSKCVVVVQGRVAEVFKRLSMKHVRAALGYHVHYAAHGQT